jgi:hypothetical protein
MKKERNLKSATIRKTSGQQHSDYRIITDRVPLILSDEMVMAIARVIVLTGLSKV